jgi:hypothetical protein
MFGAQDAYGQVYDQGRPPHEMTHELIAGAAGFEAMRMKHFEDDRYRHLDQEQARFQAQEQANYLYDQQYGQGYGQY